MIGIISAVDRDWGIGRGGRIPWHRPEDFQFFKDITAGATCFMGRKTYEEIAHMRPKAKELLPGRKCVVLTSTDIADTRITMLRSIYTFETLASSKNFFIGGRSVFEFALGIADIAYITKIPGNYDCDVQFPLNRLQSELTRDREIWIAPDLVVDVYERKE